MDKHVKSLPKVYSGWVLDRYDSHQLSLDAIRATGVPLP